MNILEKGLLILEILEQSEHPLNVQQIARLTGIHRLATSRLLVTLEGRGYVRKSEDKRYRAANRHRDWKAGYLGPLTGNEFRLDIARSITDAARLARMPLTMMNNGEYDTALALENLETLLRANVNVVIFFQPAESIGHILADRLASAAVPFISVERPIEGGVYFGANNYRAGKLAGNALGRYANEHWAGEFDRVVLVEGPQTKTNVHARQTGVLVGLAEVTRELNPAHVIHLNGDAHQHSSRAAMAGLLKTLRRGKRLLISGFNDVSAMGVLDAVTDARRQADVAIVGHNAAREARTAIRRPGSCLFASVAFFPERYGTRIMQLAGALARGERVPPAVYTEHTVLHAGNVNQLYPNEMSAVTL